VWFKSNAEALFAKQRDRVVVSDFIKVRPDDNGNDNNHHRSSNSNQLPKPENPPPSPPIHPPKFTHPTNTNKP
jgi:hypothetical protein